MHPVSGYEDITATQLKERMDRGDAPRLLDIREDWEWEMGHLPGADHLPMHEIPDGVEALDPSQEIVVYCRTGKRSAQVAGWLARRGFGQVRNLAGGVHAWSDEVDPSFRKY